MGGEVCQTLYEFLFSVMARIEIVDDVILCFLRLAEQLDGCHHTAIGVALLLHEGIESLFLSGHSWVYPMRLSWMATPMR